MDGWDQGEPVCRPRWARGLPATAIVTALGVAASLLVPTASAAVEDRATKPVTKRAVAALDSPAPTQRQVEIPAGDFTDPPPHPSEAAELRGPDRAGFDPELSALIHRDPSTQRWENPDRSTTVEATSGPVRVPDASEIDVNLQTTDDGVLIPRRGPPVRLSPAADAGASVETTAGEIVLRHPGAGLGQLGRVSAGSVRYPGALGARDLILAATSTGLEETVVLAERSAPSDCAVLSSGSCSIPGPGSFRNGCKTHDLGYNLMRFFGSSGRGGSTRKAVDNLLFNDFKGVCGGLSWWRRRGCGIAARAGYQIVAANSWDQGYGVP